MWINFPAFRNKVEIYFKLEKGFWRMIPIMIKETYCLTIYSFCNSFVRIEYAESVSPSSKHLAWRYRIWIFELSCLIRRISMLRRVKQVTSFATASLTLSPPIHKFFPVWSITLILMIDRWTFFMDKAICKTKDGYLVIHDALMQCCTCYMSIASKAYHAS